MAISSIHITLIDGTRYDVHESSFNPAQASEDAVHALWRRIENTSVVPLKPLVVRHGAGGPWVAAHFGPGAIGGIFAQDDALG